MSVSYLNKILFNIVSPPNTDVPTMAKVSICQGILEGSKCYTDKGTEYFEFLGIPYAKPPVGDLRFKSPQPPEPWEGIRDATSISQNQVACQMDLFTNNPIGTEDCLYLNVYTPKLPMNFDDKSELLSVMFHIHGGGFLHGNGIIKTESGPDYLIDNNVVVVSINYRLGIFGFLNLDIPDAAGNMGLKDQVQALIWVQNNIQEFGGDKSNVTIFGVSAGSASVEYLILSPQSKGLFHKAILQSGSSLNHWAINFEPQILLHKVLDQLGFQLSSNYYQDIYKFLMDCPPISLIVESFKVIQKSFPERLFFGFVPTIEKDFGNNDAILTSKPYKLLKEGQFNRVPVIKGFCEMEGYMMSILKPLTVETLNTSENFLNHWAYNVETDDPSKLNAKFAEAYKKSVKSSTEEQDKRIIDFFSDYDFISGIWVSGLLMSKHGVDGFLYKFSYDGKINFLKNAFKFQKQGAAHADDVTYVFKTEFSKDADEYDIIVRDKVTKLWTNFAKTSNPLQPVKVLKDLPSWPRFTERFPGFLNMGKEFVIEYQDDPNKMNIFKDIYDKYHM